MYARRVSIAVLAAFALVLTGCTTEPRTEGERADLQTDAQKALQDMTAKDPGLQDLLNNSVGYVIFPNAGKGALIAGGSFGRGPVYERGQWIGWAKIEEASVGAQIGGQKFRELLVFKTQAAWDRFRDNQYTLDANASGIILKSGAAKGAVAEKGVAVFVDPIEGAMVEAAVGGQHFVFEAANRMNRATTQPSQTEMAR